MILGRLIVFLCLVAFTVPANANDKVKQFADSLASQALDIAKSSGVSVAAKQKNLETLFRKNVDIPWIAKFVAGKHWRRADAAQKKAYTKNYEAFVLKNYASKLTEYSGQSYKIKKIRNEGDGEYLLTMELINKGQPNVMLDYRVRTVGSGYKIIDIVVEGVSMITTQRADFGSVISNKGFDFLVSALKKKASAS